MTKIEFKHDGHPSECPQIFNKKIMESGLQVGDKIHLVAVGFEGEATFGGFMIYRKGITVIIDGQFTDLEWGYLVEISF